MNPLVLLLLAGGAAVALGGKKKKTPAPPPDEQGLEFDEYEGEGEGETSDVPEYGDVVAHGQRRDKRGPNPWRILFEEGGYRVQLTTSILAAAALVQEELGMAATLTAARELIRDTLNDRLIAAGYKESDLKDAPVMQRTMTSIAIG